ncbi:Staphylococcal respiratory response protein A [uncultured Roseburia sp.]|uniref:Heme response regulator HssR n=1 Tax=Brotonthovivens ammoniilytica TaxID=2981725 RepID=A0ABT2TIZ8_9FIRM|nr:response regulator transcription factor [Brotonthovivens ammoniilytica]MCU6762190.1 response regulator transcription factor [Brotonthovivens ammoniilytica]SCI58272.1 Staphylococcal respiratory response protein A [uncultured Roseburia sp.]
MYKILVVDDEKLIRTAICEFAEFLGYSVTEASNGIEAVNICKTENFDVIIMDIMMPVLDGFSAFQKIKEIRDIPVLMLSAKGQEYDKLYGFELGIEDYVTKPFSMKELMARVNVIIKRRERILSQSSRPKQMITIGGLMLDPAAREVSLNGTPLDLRPKEYDLLFFLIQNKNIVFSRDSLLEKVWGYDYQGDDRTVDSQIKLLRQALGEYRSHIVTCRGIGYKFSTDEKE